MADGPTFSGDDAIADLAQKIIDLRIDPDAATRNAANYAIERSYGAYWAPTRLPIELPPEYRDGGVLNFDNFKPICWYGGPDGEIHWLDEEEHALHDAGLTSYHFEKVTPEEQAEMEAEDG